MANSHSDEIKRLALIAMFSHAELTDHLVLKGGNLLDLVYGVAPRGSIDLDFSIEGDFAPEEKANLESVISASLKETFSENGYAVFDIRLTEKPKHVSADMKEFWGGYGVEFKVIEEDRFQELQDDPRGLRVNSLTLGAGHRKAFRIEISKFEYCQPKQPREVDGGMIYIYTPAMIVYEKLRAICQQMPEYRRLVKSEAASARARDFVDIHAVMENFRLDLTTQENVAILRSVFEAKHVPLSLIGLITDFREYHRPDYASVEDAVKSQVKLKGFDYYFDYVIQNCCQPLQALWKE